MEMRVTSTGQYEEVPSSIDKIPDYDPRSGDHYWILPIAYRFDPKNYKSGDKGILDHENLVLVSGVGCYYCEQLYTELLATRRCKGE